MPMQDRWWLRAMSPNGGARGEPRPIDDEHDASAVPGVTDLRRGSASFRWCPKERRCVAGMPVKPSRSRRHRRSGQSRIDLVICLVRDAGLSGGADNDWIFQVVTGVRQPRTRSIPALPSSYCYVMCQLTVPGGVANLNTATLIDRR